MLMKSLVDERATWWNHYLMKYLVDETLNSTKQHDYETTSWWISYFMKPLFDELSSWWNIDFAKQTVDGTTSWQKSYLMKPQVDEITKRGKNT